MRFHFDADETQELFGQSNDDVRAREDVRVRLMYSLVLCR